VAEAAEGGAAEAATRANGERDGSPPRLALGDAALLAGLFAAAVAVRAPYLQLIPRFTDEVRRVLWSLRVLDGGFWPLAYKNGYNGALMIYVNAAALALHPGLSTPRWTAVLVASLAPPALYLLGRELHGRLAGVIAGALLATSFVPIVVFGHIPWAITPAATLVVAGLWLVAHAVRRRSTAALVLGAAGLGLALQTHPLAAITLPGAALWLADRARRTGWPGRRPAAAALAAAALAFSPLVLHHALEFAREGRLEITSTRDLRDGEFTLAGYGLGARALGGSLVDVLSAQAHDAEHLRRRDPFAWLVGMLAVGALGLSAWRGPRLAAAATASGLIVLPALVTTYNFPLSARYTGLLLPTVYLALGIALARGWQRARHRTAGAATRAALAGIALLLVLFPLARVRTFYAHDVARGRTNRAVLGLAEAARDRWAAQGADRAAIILDDEIAASYSASGNISRVVEMLLGLHGVSIAKVATAEELDEALGEAEGPRVVVASDALRASARHGDALEPVAGTHVLAGGDGDGFGLYAWPGLPGDETPP